MTDQGNKVALTIEINRLERSQKFLKGSKLGKFVDKELVRLRGLRQDLDKKKDPKKKDEPEKKDEPKKKDPPGSDR